MYRVHVNVLYRIHAYIYSGVDLIYYIYCLFKDVPSYVYMNKRLKTDAAGIPHRSLDSYQHSSSRAPAFKAPYNSFTSSGSPSSPTSSPPKPPRSCSSNSNYTRASSYTNPNSRTSQKSRENYNSRSLDSHSSRSLDSSSSHYNRLGTSSSYYGNETFATFSLRITPGSAETPRRNPPPPPPTNSPGLHDPSGHEVDIYSSDPTRTQPSSTGVSFMLLVHATISLVPFQYMWVSFISPPKGLDTRLIIATSCFISKRNAYHCSYLCSS